jgi:biopolymer transport protein ExbD
MIAMTSEVSTASMSDIAFLLIIFFMVASVFTLKDGLHLVLPDSTKTPVAMSPRDVIAISAPDENRILLDSRVVSLEQLESNLGELARQNDRHVLLTIAGSVPYHRAVALIDAVKHAGFSRLSVTMR